ncbi:MAG: Fic family protein [Jatrophihabitantaceae bacterium]
MLAQAAIAHAQFETIHPFADGNGRTGGALVHVMLQSKKMVTSATVPISDGLLADKGRHFKPLTSYRKGDAAWSCPYSLTPRCTPSIAGGGSLLESATSRQVGDPASRRVPTRPGGG